MPFQLWRYRFIEGVGNNVIIEFRDSNRNGEYRMTADPADPAEKLAALNAPPDARDTRGGVSKMARLNS